jgi:branched-chain amino acid transport system ATP-binding protein
LNPLVKIRGLTVTYGGVHANENVDLDIGGGQLVGMIGPNGAGKTTFIDAISGFVKPTSGTVVFEGEEITNLSPSLRARRKLTRTFQSLELFDDLPVTDNLLVASEEMRWWSVLRDSILPRHDAAAREHVQQVLALLEIEHSADRLPTDLSHGERKLVSVARALVADPRVVLLDEPAAGLDTSESKALGEKLRHLRDRGLTIFLVDHDMGLVLNVCDYIYVLDFGRIISQGKPAEVRSDPAVIAAYLGESAGEIQAKGLV